MARVPLLTPETAEPSVAAIFDEIEAMGQERFMNQFRALAHHPPLVTAMHGLLRAFYEETVVPKKYLELAIMMVSHLNRCNYCVVHHTPPALAHGVDGPQLMAIEDGTWEKSGVFDEVEVAVLKFAHQMNQRNGRVDDSLFNQLRETFSQQQMVELTMRTAMCEFFNRFNEALQLEIEPVAEALYRDATA